MRECQNVGNKPIAIATRDTFKEAVDFVCSEDEKGFERFWTEYGLETSSPESADRGGVHCIKGSVSVVCEGAVASKALVNKPMWSVREINHDGSRMRVIAQQLDFFLAMNMAAEHQRQEPSIHEIRLPVGENGAMCIFDYSVKPDYTEGSVHSIQIYRSGSEWDMQRQTRELAQQPVWNSQMDVWDALAEAAKKQQYVELPHFYELNPEYIGEKAKRTMQMHWSDERYEQYVLLTEGYDRRERERERQKEQAQEQQKEERAQPVPAIKFR